MAAPRLLCDRGRRDARRGAIWPKGQASQTRPMDQANDPHGNGTIAHCVSTPLQSHCCRDGERFRSGVAHKGPG